jgi:hypothetical protein
VKRELVGPFPGRVGLDAVRRVVFLQGDPRSQGIRLGLEDEDVTAAEFGKQLGDPPLVGEEVRLAVGVMGEQG